MRLKQRARQFGLWVVGVCLCAPWAAQGAQSESYKGTYTTQNGAITLQLKPVGKGYHGALKTSQAFFALKANVAQSSLKGRVYTGGYGDYDFTATLSGKVLSVVFQGQTYYYQKVSDSHQLDGVDLSGYFKQGDNLAQAPDNSGAYTQHIAGSQLVYYTRTSYVLSSDINASSITYVNFCRDGRFHINYDGSFMVKGGYGGSASGASVGAKHGRWTVGQHQGSPAVRLYFANGEQGVYPFNPQFLHTGRWRVGNTQYALQKNKVNCP